MHFAAIHHQVDAVQNLLLVYSDLEAANLQQYFVRHPSSSLPALGCGPGRPRSIYFDSISTRSMSRTTYSHI
jgi:hypothetical protein